MKVKFKKLDPNATIPTKATAGSAGFDLRATSRINQSGSWVYGTGLAIEIPKGHVGLIFPRSSVFKTNLGLRNCVGVIDSDYRGEITLKFRPDAKYPIVYNIGEAVGQIIILKTPAIEFVEAELLSDTKRGSGGYGSTGK
jgi:dUTP pyrophosphatase